MPKFLTPEEYAKELRISPSQVRRLCQAGKIPAVKVGGQWRIRAGEDRGESQEIKAVTECLESMGDAISKLKEKLSMLEVAGALD